MVVCLDAYAEGYYVPFRDGLVDTAPFVAAALSVAAWRYRGSAFKRVSTCLALAVVLSGVIVWDCFRVAAGGRRDLKHRHWIGQANVAPKDDDAVAYLEFLNDTEAKILIGSTNRMPVFNGKWSLEPDLFRTVPRVRFRGFGTAEMRKEEHLKISGMLNLLNTGNGSTEITAYLLPDKDEEK